MRVFLVLVAMLVWARPAEACSCKERSDAEALEQVAVVIEGTVTLASKDLGRGAITVTKSLKGSKSGEKIEFRWVTGSAFMCPTVELKPGKWRLYLVKKDEGLTLSTCDFNSRAL